MSVLSNGPEAMMAVIYAFVLGLSAGLVVGRQVTIRWLTRHRQF